MSNLLLASAGSPRRCLSPFVPVACPLSFPFVPFVLILDRVYRQAEKWLAADPARYEFHYISVAALLTRTLLVTGPIRRGTGPGHGVLVRVVR